MPRRTVRSLQAVLIACGTLCLLVLSAAGAQAADEGVQGLLREGNSPIAGVRLTVSGADQLTATATTNAQGRWKVAVPGPGQYRVALDTASLPAGVTLRDPARNPFTADVRSGQTRAVIFPFGADTRPVASVSDRAVNLFGQGLRFGLLIALASVGLLLVFGTTGLTNFAHRELVTFGALIAYAANAVLDLPLLAAVMLAAGAGAAAGWSTDAGLWAPLRRRRTGLISMMIISIGLRCDGGVTR